jgi:hypothetical protein
MISKKLHLLVYSLFLLFLVFTHDRASPQEEDATTSDAQPVATGRSDHTVPA